MGLWRTRCPVPEREQRWIERHLDWLTGQFGDARLRGEVLLPTDEHFPGVYRGSDDDVRGVLYRLCAHVGVLPSSVELEIDPDAEDDDLSRFVPLEYVTDGAAGHFRVRDGRPVITVRGDQALRPLSLVATLAHELGHVRLLGERRADPAREDQEPLTDLATVFFGLGVFTANAAFDFSRAGGYTRTSRLGYLTEPMFGYALARYAWMRGERNPSWLAHLDTNPRTYAKRGLRFLAGTSREGVSLWGGE